jgi:hypothetical protein
MADHHDRQDQPSRHRQEAHRERQRDAAGCTDQEAEQRLGQRRDGMNAPEIGIVAERCGDSQRTGQHEGGRREDEHHRLPDGHESEGDKQCPERDHRRSSPAQPDRIRIIAMP